MSERQNIYEDLNESSSARPGGSQQLEVLPSPNSKRTTNFSAEILASRRNFSWRRDFNARQSPIVCLNFYQAPIFCIAAYILYTSLNFHESPEF
jgi:hypothetical protein